jgi:hypothetical protein
MKRIPKMKNKPELITFFKEWVEKDIKELDGKKLIFPDDWGENFPEEAANYFIEYFQDKNEE